MLLGEYGRAHRYTKRSLEHLAVGFEPMGYMFARSGAALTYMMAGRWEAALREVDEAVATGAERSDAGIVSFCNAIGALVCVEKRDWATAIDYGTAAKETAPTVYFRGFAFGFRRRRSVTREPLTRAYPSSSRSSRWPRRHAMSWRGPSSRRGWPTRT